MVVGALVVDEHAVIGQGQGVELTLVDRGAIVGGQVEEGALVTDRGAAVGGGQVVEGAAMVD